MKPREQGTFNIVRFYAKEGQASRIMRRGLTWRQAQEHVNDPKTKKDGKWFDGFVQID